MFSDPLQQEEQMGWHPSVVKRTRIRVIGENFSDFLIGLAGSSDYPSSSYRGSTVFALSTSPCNRRPEPKRLSLWGCAAGSWTPQPTPELVQRNFAALYLTKLPKSPLS